MSFAFFLFCVQVCLVQNVYSQCLRGTAVPPAVLGCGGGAGYGLGAGLGLGAGIGAEIGSGQGGVLGLPTGYGGSGIGEVAVTGEVPVGGNTIVEGQVPVLGSVYFDGAVPARGSVSITGSCGCGCHY